MAVTVRSFGKINLGLRLGERRADGFHQLRTVYQTISLHDTIRIEVQRGTGIELRSKNSGVPLDESNTCWRVAERVMKATRQRSRVVVSLEKRLPVQGGLGAASSNGVAVLLGLERLLGVALEPEERLRIAAEVGSDLPLFLVGGTVLGLGRGEQVFPLEDLPPIDIVVATPAVGVSTAQAFADWDAQFAAADKSGGLTASAASATIDVFSRSVFAWLTARLPRTAPNQALRARSENWQSQRGQNRPASGALSAAPITTAGVPAAPKGATRSVTARAGGKGRGRVETMGAAGASQSHPGQPMRAMGLLPQSGFPLLLDLVRAGIENDFERVVFPKYPAVREVKRGLERAGARYASLSGSGSSVYGLFDTAEQAQAAAAQLNAAGVPAWAANAVPRDQYWAELFVV